MARHSLASYPRTMWFSSAEFKVFWAGIKQAPHCDDVVDKAEIDVVAGEGEREPASVRKGPILETEPQAEALNTEIDLTLGGGASNVSAEQENENWFDERYKTRFQAPYLTAEEFMLALESWHKNEGFKVLDEVSGLVNSSSMELLAGQKGAYVTSDRVGLDAPEVFFFFFLAVLC